MFKSMVKKLKNNDGSSVVYALIFFLVVSIIGTMIITTSRASIGRANRLKEGQNAYYVSISTFKVIKGELDNQTIKYNHEKTIDENMLANSDGNLLIFKKFMIDGYKDVVANGNDYREELYMTVTDPQSGKNYIVTMSAKISSFDYSVTFEITNILVSDGVNNTSLRLNNINKITFEAEEIVEDDVTSQLIVKYLEGKVNG